MFRTREEKGVFLSNLFHTQKRKVLLTREAKSIKSIIKEDKSIC